MLTIRAEIKKGEQKADGTYNVKIRFTKNRQVKRISTSLFATPNDITRSGELKKNTLLMTEIDSLVTDFRRKCMDLHLDSNNYSLDYIISLLKYEEEESNPIDFIAFAKKWIKQSKIKSKDSYNTALNSFIRFIQKDSFDVKDITSELIARYKINLEQERDARNKKLKDEGKRIPSNRSVSLYLIILRRIFNEAKKQFNRPDIGKQRINNSPFDNIDIPKQEATRKRAIPAEMIQKIYTLPYHNKKKGVRSSCRYDLAKDMFILSFCLIGMNSVDIYNATELVEDTLLYNRSKTKDRRIDEARMLVTIPSMVLSIIEKYKDKSGKRLFRFYKDYADRKAFNKAINKGLKQIGDELEIEDLEFYAARHSWATIALNKCKIDKYTVHAALNHVDPSMKVTDIYIERDFVAENEANKKVLEYVFGK